MRWFMQICLVALSGARHQPQMSYLSVPVVPEPKMILRPLLREMETVANGCDEACFVVHVEAVVRKAAGRAWATLDSNDDGQLDLEELRKTILDFNSSKKRFTHEKYPQ